MKKRTLSICLALATLTAFGGFQNKTTPDKPDRLYVKEYSLVNQTTHTPLEPEYWTESWIYSEGSTTWQDQDTSNGETLMRWIDGGTMLVFISWPPSVWPSLQSGTGITYRPNHPPSTNSTLPPTITLEHCTFDVSGTLFDSTLRQIRTADAKMHLETGGRSLSNRKNLFRFDASATEIPANDWVLTPHGVPATSASKPIPSQQISISGLGNLGADGKLYVALPDNTDIDVTPFVNNKDFYTFDVTRQKHTAYITANDFRLDPSSINSTNCVGQKIVFRLQFDPQLPEEVQTADYQWVLSAKYVNGWEEWAGNGNTGYRAHMCHPETNWWSRSGGGEAPDAPYCKLYNIFDWPLKQRETGAWWVSGGRKSAGCLAELNFGNGQKVTISAVGKLHMHRPTVSNFTALANDMWWDYPSLQGIMNFNISLNSEFDGLFGITQIINGTTFYYNTLGEDHLDGNTEIYGEPDHLGSQVYSDSNTTTLLDTPHAPGTPCVDLEAKFKNFLRFKPGIAENDGNIYVTIATNGWYMDGSACLWSGMTKSNLPPATAPVNCEDFPVWTNTHPE